MDGEDFIPVDRNQPDMFDIPKKVHNTSVDDIESYNNSSAKRRQ